MDAHLDAPLDLAQLAALAHFSPYHFIRVFHKTFHETPYQYLIRKRLEKAKALNVTRFLENCAVVELTGGRAIFEKREANNCAAVGAQYQTGKEREK
ncbi:MAG: AraC family transcriptional regulator [Chloroflexi bacterium]|nr:AraC family transcriptional regulator [Chloroflexota bacterium]